MNQVATLPNRATSVIVRMGERYGVDADKLLGTLKATAFKGEVSTEQMMMLLVVADQYHLNPFTKEIYAFPSRGGIVPIVGVDGWARIINENPNFDGMDFEDGPLAENKIPEWIECRMHRKDRAHPVCVREYFAEVNRGTDPWKSHPRRMLRHKAMIQAARLAFGFVGIYDDDEGERVREAIDVTPAHIDPRGDLVSVDYVLRDKHVAEIAKLFDELGSDPEKIGAALRDYVQTNLAQFHELYIATLDKLVADGVTSKSYFRSLVK
jgi:phage recombination protein Bet